jgi:ATP-dependent DNA ligase
MFVDRAGNQFRPPGADAIAVGLKAGTVLDGEIVFNLHFQKSVFLVFDVLCNEGQPCAHLPFEERTALITGPVMARVGRINYQAPEGPLWIIRKKFWPKKDLKNLLKLMVR